MVCRAVPYLLCYVGAVPYTDCLVGLCPTMTCSDDTAAGTSDHDDQPADHEHDAVDAMTTNSPSVVPPVGLDVHHAVSSVQQSEHASPSSWSCTGHLVVNMAASVLSQSVQVSCSGHQRRVKAQ